MTQDNPRTCKLSAIDAAQDAHATGGQLLSTKPAALVLAIAAYVVGGGGMLAWLGFLFMGPWYAVDFGISAAAKLLVNASLCLLFFVQHSLMVRRRFRLWLTRSVRADFHGALYAVASGGCLLVLVGLWQPVGTVLWQPPAAARWAMAIVFLAAGIGAWWGSQALGEFDALGVKPALQAFDRPRPTAGNAFTVRGPYRWVRHPLYLFSLIIIWSGPVFTWDRMLHNTLWTIWIVIGATMEERDLVDCFGNAYRDYQKAVPMLLPKSVRPLVAESFGHTNKPL